MYYCGICHWLREDYGFPIGMFANWDSRFIALLVGAQYADGDKNSRTTCPISISRNSKPIAGFHVAHRYAAAVLMFLLGEKLDDDIRDDNSLVAKLFQRLLREKVEKSEIILRRLDFPLDVAMGIRSEQRKVESTENRLDLYQLTNPTAKAIGSVFAHTAIIAKEESNYDNLYQIGNHVGRIIPIVDACDDYEADQKKNKFNELIVAYRIDNNINNHKVHSVYNEVEKFLLDQLRMIRTYYSDLVLFRHQNIICNILAMGMYDIVLRACTNIARVFSIEMSMPVEIRCPKCNVLSPGKFCANCGQYLPILNMEVLNNEYS